jgi:hypothetical protein
MNYTKFSNQIKSGDYARNNLFEVYIPIIGLASAYDKGVQPDDGLRFNIKAAQLPGKQLGTMEVKRFGAVYKVANDVIVDTFPMTVICSSDMRERRFFDNWMSGIHGQISGGTTAGMYRMSYYDDYVTSVLVTQNRRAGDAAYAVTLEEAYPTSMGAVELSWEQGEVSTFTVNMSYRRWVASDVD